MNRSTWISFLSVFLIAFAGAGCGDDDTNPADMGRDGPGDMDQIDQPPPVDMGNDVESVDLARDSGDMSDMGMLTPESMLIRAVRDAELGGHIPPLPVEGAIVTYVRPMIGTDPAGFFVQAQQTGPALFVAVDPGSLSPNPSVGDTVSFNVTITDRRFGQHRVTAIEGFSRTATGFDVSTLVQEVSATEDLSANINLYESELVSVTGTLMTDAYFAGTDHHQFRIDTVSIEEDALVVFRAPDSLLLSEGIGVDCSVSVGPTPLWRYRVEAVLSAWRPEDITNVTCDDLTVRDAKAADSRVVLVRFSRPVAPGSLGPEDFTFSPSLTVTGVSVDGTIVTVNTQPQMLGVDYTVTVSGVTDGKGGALDGANNMSSFGGVGNTVRPGPGDLVISEIFYNTGAVSDIGLEWFEIINLDQPMDGVTYQLHGCFIDDIEGDEDPQPLEWSFFARPEDVLVFGGRPLGEPPGDDRLRMDLDDMGDTVRIVCGGMDVDSVNYGVSGFPSAAGSSIQLDPAVGDPTINDSPFAWCVAEEDQNYGNMGFHGTPAELNTPCPGGQIIISEYVEGSGMRQAVEIASIGGAPYDLADCEIRLYADGNTAPVDFPLPDIRLLPNETYVLCNIGVPNASCDQTDMNFTFDGNDTIAIACSETLLDVFGQIGSADVFMGAGGVSAANRTLRRSCMVSMGDTNGTDPFDLSGYDAANQDDISDLGNFTCP